MKVISFINACIFGPLLPCAVFAAGLFLSVKLKFFHIRYPRKLSGIIAHSDNAGTSPMKAMSVALAGTLGVGNIAGVAAAIEAGGAGAIFWMWVSALFAMILKYGETLLAVKHRRSIIDGGKRRHTGGAFAYMQDSGHKILAFVFAGLCVITSVSMGSIVQSNAIAVSLENSFSVSPYVCGIIFAVLTFFVICGGFKRISDFTVLAVPLFCILYSLFSLYIIFTNFTELPRVFGKIISEAFSLRSAGGGILGFAFINAMRYGVLRGILSNEAGSGTSVTAHAASDTDSPCKQGVFGILEVFVDTILLCSMTALVILIADNISPGAPAMVIAISAYGKFIGGVAPGFMSAAIVFFAFATIVCWSVYGAEALRFLTSDYFTSVKFSKCKYVYYLLYSISVFFGCIVSGEFMWELSDLSTAVMTLINTGYLISAYKEIRAETNVFVKQYLRS